MVSLSMPILLWTLSMTQTCVNEEAECDLNCGPDPVFITSDCECVCDLSWDDEDSDEEYPSWGIFVAIAVFVAIVFCLFICLRVKPFILRICQQHVAQQRKARFFADKIPLSIHSHRGHQGKDDKYHPRNVLDDDKDTYYQSASGHDASRPEMDQHDWITFKMETPFPVIVKGVTITNSMDNLSLTSIALSSSEDGDSFQELLTNYDIKENVPLISIWVCGGQNGCNFIRLKVLESLSDGRNAFHSFSVYGVLCEDEEAIPLAEP